MDGPEDMLALTFPLLVGLTTSWSAVKRGPASPRCSGQSTANLESDGRVLLFGGLTGSAGSAATDKLWAYEDGGWQELTTEGGPGPRMYAASAALGRSFFVFGGWDPEEPGSGGTFKDDVWKLDVDSLRWERVGAMPCGPVSRHAACTVGDTIVVHTFRSTLVCGEDGALREVATSGDAPDSLSMCAVAPLGSDGMLLFGGATKNQAMSQDAYVLDTATWAWRRLRASGDAPPTPRAGACAAPIDGSTVAVFGGGGIGENGYDGGKGLCGFDDTFVLRVDGDEAVWHAVGSADEDKPPPRTVASLSALPCDVHGKDCDDACGKLLLQGGWNPVTKETYDEPWVLQLG